MATASQPLPNRIHSLDQFRGYTILGMFLVNYMGSYKSFVPPILLHHNVSCSYADTIMPHFLFAVGFAFRLSFGRKQHEGGLTAAYWRVVRRILGLLVVTFSVYHVGRIADSWEQLTEMTFWEIFEKPVKREWLQTLGHIAVTSLWILPWMRTSVLTRVIVMIVCALAHHAACYYGYFLYANTGPAGIDGGPLGFLTWTTPALLGTITCDWVQDAREKHKHPNLIKMFTWSAIIMLIGWLITPAGSSL
ncbi:MAG: heparan-alpha-glucosaminide N-acetyltransferase domain-containing protein [Planctomycetaceae bacterium]